jgi:hypothetical protein
MEPLPVFPDHSLSLFEGRKPNEFYSVGLSRRGAFRLAKCMIGIDQYWVPRNKILRFRISLLADTHVLLSVMKYPLGSSEQTVWQPSQPLHSIPQFPIITIT